MKRLIQIIAVLSVICFAGMQTVNAQAPVQITWTLAESGCNCHTLQDSIYRVIISVVDVCAQPPAEIYNDVNIESGSASSSDFILDVDCNDYNNEPCFRIIATVIKLCPDGYGGYTIECQGYSISDLFTCDELQGTTPLSVPIVHVD